MAIDFYRLRRDLMDYYGSAMDGDFPMAMMEVSEAETASPDGLIRMAERAGIDLERYEV